MFEWLDFDKLLTADLARSLFTALFGASLGAWAAQNLGARIREREERLKTVRAGNAATMLAYVITDSLLGFKHQLVKPSVDQYFNERRRIIAETEASKNRPPGSFMGPAIIEANAEMNAFSLLATPVKELQDIVLKQVSPQMRPVWMMGALSGALVSLEQITAERNELISDFRKASAEGKNIIEAFYGLKSQAGADERYAHMMEHLRDRTDDAIYFSKLIGDDLLRYANALRSTLPEAARPFAPVIVSADFSRRADIMPDATKYKDYDKMFQQVRALGTGIWSGRFEALALVQLQTESEFFVM